MATHFFVVLETWTVCNKDLAVISCNQKKKRSGSEGEARTSRQPGEDQESSGQFGEDVDLGREAGQGDGPEGKGINSE